MARLGCTAAAVLAALVMAGAAAAAGWMVQPVPAPVIHDGQLLAVSCTSPSACVAVGSATNSGGTQVTLAERWNGTSWKVRSTPDPNGATQSSLDGVSCTSTSACTAVGNFTNAAGTPLTLAERWNGSSWAIQSTPNPAGTLTDNGLSAVSCPSSTACTAVGTFVVLGSFSMMLVERWDGTSWAIQSTPNPPNSTESHLLGVSCSSTSNCTAVGYFRDVVGNQPSLAEHWDGTSWTVQSTPNPTDGESVLTSVSCPTASACTAVGTFSPQAGTLVTLAEGWDGTSWTIQSTPNPNGAPVSDPTAVSCASATVCTAVGSFRDSTGDQAALAEGWDGTSWTIESVPNPSGGNNSQLDGVSCTATSGCIATGSHTNSAGTQLTLAEGLDSSSWTIKATPNPLGLQRASLTDVSCPALSACTAVGSYYTSNTTVRTLAAAWNGTAWTLQTPRNPTGENHDQLSGVSCTSTSACTGVGYFTNTAGTQVTLAERWNGTTWAVQSTPNPLGIYGGTLSGVSCGTASACAGVGHWTYRYIDSLRRIHFKYYMLAEGWNGTIWALESPPNPTGATNSELNGVSCTSSFACTAVGYSAGSAGTQMIVERWNGTSWVVQTPPNPTGATSSVLNGVSCTSAIACTAVGYFTNSSGTTMTLAETWNGTSWAVESTPNPTTSNTNQLAGVSCTATSACTAVGSSGGSGGTHAALAEGWNGTSWAIETTPNPTSATSSELNGLSCTATSVCTAVGDFSPSLVVSPLAERYS